MLFICVLCRRPCIVKELSLLSCGHGLHRSCLTNGILLNSSCPKCCRPFCRIPPVSKVYLDGEQPAENDKECGNSEQADLVNTILENRKQYQAKIEERTEELLSFDKKIREVGERLKTTGEAVSDIVELEEEWQSLESAIGEVKKENRRLRRQYVHLKQKRADIMKLRLRQTGRLALAKRKAQSARFRETARVNPQLVTFGLLAVGKPEDAVDEQPVASS
ncbi:zinc finger, C3HC4 type [Trichuris suis]|nr:zinc finger, C3HC4 type [Trichuris suis]